MATKTITEVNSTKSKIQSDNQKKNYLFIKKPNVSNKNVKARTIIT